MDIHQIRSQFPQLGEKVYGRQLVYLDNAATSLRPVQVVEKWDEMSLRHNSNLHRAVHKTAVDATEEYESTRAAVAAFIGAAEPSEIIFTSGTTQSCNLLASCLENGGFFREGDEILICGSEHHSNIVPWQMVAGRKGLKIKVLPVDDRGEIRISELPALLSGRTRLCAVAQVSNVLGIINPIPEIARICHANGTLLFVDGAQGIPHLATDVRQLGCDFYAFSGHKMYAAPGTGILYGRRELLEAFPPYMGGGEMIESVSWEKTTYAPIPRRFEAGTQNISGVPTLRPAMEMCKLLESREISAGSDKIRAFLMDFFASRPDITLYGNPADPARKLPIFSITVEGAHHEDLALLLDKMGVAVRSGQMCAEPLMDRFGVTGMVRASFAPYNTLEEAGYFVESRKKAIKMLS